MLKKKKKEVEEKEVEGEERRRRSLKLPIDSFWMSYFLYFKCKSIHLK